MAEQYATTTKRRLVSIPVGAVVGGIGIFAILLVVPNVFSFGPEDSKVSVTLAVSAFLSFAWLIAIILLWLPLWLWAERHRPIGWSRAAIWGGALGAPTSLVILAIMWTFAAAMGSLEDSSYRWQNLVRAFAILASACSVVGLIVASAIWRIAYRRTVTPAVADTFD